MDDMKDLVSKDERDYVFKTIMDQTRSVAGYKKLIRRLLLTLDAKDAEINLMRNEFEDCVVRPSQTTDQKR